MANITAADVNKLRQETGIGMMDCKKALVEAEGDFEKARDILRKKGQKVAAKRADRTSNEGRIIAKTNADRTKGYMLVMACEVRELHGQRPRQSDGRRSQDQRRTAQHER